MFSSLRLGQWFGIGVFVHPTFWLLPLFVLFSSAANYGPHYAALDLAVLFAAFGCVALHEFGHALAARWYGIRTRDITLYPIGGVARLENMPERPWPEIVVALAGPAVNVAIAAGILTLFLVSGVGVGSALAAGPSAEAFWARLLATNIILVLFNLIPAFPMDGGRVVRAVVSWFTDRVTATEIAAGLGAVMAVLMGLFGLFTGSFMLVILAAFVFLAGRGELAAVRYRAEEERAERRWRRAYATPWGDIPFARPVQPAAEPEPVDGWEFDPGNGMWTEWRGGRAVRRVRAE
jgi:Zn-dependent protease